MTGKSIGIVLAGGIGHRFGGDFMGTDPANAPILAHFVGVRIESDTWHAEKLHLSRAKVTPVTWKSDNCHFQK